MLMNVQTGKTKQKSCKVEKDGKIEDLNNNNKFDKIGRDNSKEYETIDEFRTENSKKKLQ